MKYIVCDKPFQFSVEEKSIPVRLEGQALLKVKRVGICGTDLHAYQGNQAFFTYPRILGHELACEVLEIEENEKKIRAGDKVAVVPYINCGHCVACRNGKTNCCSSLSVLGVHEDGGMQEQIVVPLSYLLPANHLSLDQIAVLEPLSIGAHAIRRAAVAEGETIVVIGCGPIGMGIMKQAELAGATVIAVDVNEERLKWAQKDFGASYLVNARENPVEKIREITGGDLAAAVFDASGNKAALESGPQYMSHGGRFILVGLYKEGLTYQHPQIHAKEASLLCSRNATPEDFEKVMSLMDRFPLDAYITHRVSFDEMTSHFESWLKPETGVLKAMVEL